MALFQCPDCKKPISENAENCPKCGRKIAPEDIMKWKEASERSKKTGKRVGLAVGLFIIAFAIIGTVFGPSSSGKKAASIQAIADSIEKTVDGFDGHEISTDKELNLITVDVWNDGLASSIATLKSSGLSDAAMWNELKESFVKLCNSMVGVCKASGRDDISVALNIKNDINKDNTLLSVFNGVVVYDVMEE